MDYAQEIYKLIASYLPNTNIEIGRVIPATDVSLSGTDLILEVAADDYAFIQGKITSDANYSYTTGGFRIKNRITSFELYPSGATSYFGFLANFERMIKNPAGSDIDLKGFEDTDYNTTYRIVRKIDDYNIIIAPLNDLAIALPTGDLGFYSTLFSGGLNGLKTITDYGENLISFTIDQNSDSVVTTVDDLDLDTMPNLWFYQENILVANLGTFIRNLADGENADYIIIDTTSLVGSSMSSKSNNTDAPYNSFGTNAYFCRSYAINIAYVLQRISDDSKNLTETGADIVNKQVAMFDALTSILRRPITSSDKLLISSITITEDSVDKAIIEGSIVILYQCSFVINYLPGSILDLSDDGSYKINQVNFNSDEITV